ncbi:MAG: MFS transporter [Eubacteriales bacterium]|nr:MFS transporter [Eubacteriales bacterium]
MFKLLDNAKKRKAYFMCCICYISSGMMALVFGAILPQLIKEAGFSYTLAGGLVSYMALGQVVGNLFLPEIIKKIGIKRAAMGFTLLIPVCLSIFTFLPPVAIMFMMVILLGCSRGTITITTSLVSNAVSGNSSSCINFINACFALGAVLAPALISICSSLGFGWRIPVYIISVFSFISAILYRFIDFDYINSLTEDKNNPVSENVIENQNNKSNKNFLFSSWYIFVILANFFYVAIENSINGWFTSYLKDTGIMSANMSRYMVSVTWGMILIGRFSMAQVPESVPKKKLMLLDAVFGFVGLFIVLRASNIAIILPALMLTGFCMAGMYPTALSYVGEKLQATNSNKARGIAWFCALSTLGGMIGPQLIGMAADFIGIKPAMGIMGLYGGLWLLFTILLYIKKNV